MAFNASPKKAPCTFRQVFPVGVGELKDSENALARFNSLCVTLRKRNRGCILTAQKFVGRLGDGFESDFYARNDEIHMVAIRAHSTNALIRGLSIRRPCARWIVRASSTAIAS